MSIGDSLSELLNEKALQLVELDGKSITQLLGVYCNILSFCTGFFR